MRGTLIRMGIEVQRGEDVMMILLLEFRKKVHLFI